MAAKNELRITKHQFRTPEEVSVVIEDTLREGKAIRIVVEDDRGGQGTINVYVTNPRKQ